MPSRERASRVTLYVRSIKSRVLGRVFTYDDCLHFVVDVDEETGLARCNRCGRGGIDIILMPVAEVVLRLQWEQEGKEEEQLEDVSAKVTGAARPPRRG